MTQTRRELQERPRAAQTLQQLLERYAAEHPAEAATCERFLEFARGGPDCFERSRQDGHFTASCWLVSADGLRVLLTHHRKLGRWLQLGGHADGDPDLNAVCLREAEEESGLVGLTADDEIFDLDAHTIPARAHEPEHIHWDVRFVVRCTASEEFAISDESLALAWLPIAAIAEDESADVSLRRMARKWLGRVH
jgi:8-oxo-dGTP pyrophosphatase MutT (NUDIX family)